MTLKYNRGPWWGGFVAAAVLTVSAVAHADVPDATWSGLRNQDVILATASGKRLGGKLIDVDAKSVALVLPDGSSVTIARVDIREARAAGDAPLPSYGGLWELRPEGPRPRVLRWNPGEPIPYGYSPTTERRLDLIIGGSVTFGAAWVPTAGLAVFGGPLMAIPVAGPLFAFPVEGERTAGLLVLLVIDSVQQAAGLTMLIVGASTHRTILRDETSSAKSRWMPVPMTFGQGSAGLGILGTM